MKYTGWWSGNDFNAQGWWGRVMAAPPFGARTWGLITPAQPGRGADGGQLPEHADLMGSGRRARPAAGGEVIAAHRLFFFLYGDSLMTYTHGLIMEVSDLQIVSAVRQDR